MPYNAEHVRKLHEQYLGSQNISETSDWLKKHICSDWQFQIYGQWCHTSIQQHNEEPSLSSTSSEDGHFLIPAKTYSTLSISSVTDELIPFSQTRSYPQLYPVIRN